MDPSRQALEILAAVAGRPADELERDQHLMADLGLDSPKALQLIMDLEDGLGIEIDDDASAGLETVGDVLDFAARQSA